MRTETYAAEARHEATHWWFVGRRALFARELNRIGIPRDAAALDIGTSTGGNLRVLRQVGFARVEGLDNSDEAIRFCAEKGLGAVQLGDICGMPYPDASFDVILATDIIEHVTDDAKALQEVARVLRPGGHVLLTVPAFQSLWGLQDRMALHQRRYRRRSLLDRMRNAGLRPERAFYFNYFLFGPIWLARRIIDLFHVELASEADVTSPWLNRILGWIFTLDIATAPVLRPPFGVSILVVARRS